MGDFWTPASTDPGGGGGGAPDFVNYLAARLARETSNANDDFFDDGSLDAAWTTLTVSGGQTITELDDRLSIVPTSTMTASDYNALLKPVTPSTGDYIETRLTLFMTNTAAAGDGIGAGLVWADGNAAGANLCSFEVSRQPNQYGPDFRYLTRTGTFTAFGSGSIANEHESLSHLYLRLEYDAADTFRCLFSGDGVSWIDLGTQAKTMTPTHVGLIWTTFGGAIARRSATFDYFRYN